MHVLVFGGTRFMGYHLTWRLLCGGHRVTLLNRGRTKDPFAARVERLHGDRTTGDVARLLKDRRFDAVVDFTAYQGPEVATVVEALGAGGAGHYVLISTGQVYLVREDAPRPSRESDYAGRVMAAVGPTSVIRPFSITTVTLSSTGPPLPSSTRRLITLASGAMPP